jgi:cytochrome c oxidase subunit I+III
LAQSIVSGVLGVYCVHAGAGSWTVRRSADRGHRRRHQAPTYVRSLEPRLVGHGHHPDRRGHGALLAAFSYVFLWSRNPGTWAPPPDLATLPATLGPYLLAALLAWGACVALRLNRPRSGGIGTAMMVVASLCIAAGWGFDWRAWHTIGADPTATAQAAMVYAFIAWDGFFAFVSVLMGLFVALRWAAGLVSVQRPSTFDLIALFFVYTAIQGTASSLLTRLFPGA